MRTSCRSLGCLLSLFLCAAALAEDNPRTIRVTGEGRAFAPPDMATIATGVMTKAATAQEALEHNTKAMKSILAVVREHDIAPRDVQTTFFGVQPVYSHDPAGRTLPEIIAYSVTNQVRVRVRRLADLGKVLDALVRAGSNQVSGVQFDIDDPAPLLTLARERAIVDARQRAETYAKAAGVQVGVVHTISEQGLGLPQPRFLEGAALDRAAVPIATGEQEIRVSIQVVFTLEPKSTASK